MCVEHASLSVCVHACVRMCECEYLYRCACISPYPSHALGNQSTERMMSRETRDMFSPRYPIQGKGKDVVPASEL